LPAIEPEASNTSMASSVQGAGASSAARAVAVWAAAAAPETMTADARNFPSETMLA
jgi:hypothetical protein